MIPYIRDINGIKTLFVDGEPFAILGAQCDIWRSTKQDDKVVEFIGAYREMNATTVSFGVPWAKIEVEKNRYDFSFMDWFIQRTEAAGLKLVINLFNSNVCGKCEELTDGERYPQYTPDYIKENRDKYTRIIHNENFPYHPGGPPMCPNDPATLEREILYIRRVARHLKEHDTNRTVILIQLNNEYFYQQWAECENNTQKQIRCICKYCVKKYDPEIYESGEEFMFTSFAEYTRGLTDSFKAIYPLPLYINSPWWAPYIISIFLDKCSNLDFVGIDGISSTVEPNQLSVGQRDKNIPFAAESPTEAGSTKRYLTTLPYYTVLKMRGFGDLLWEAPEPNTVVYDEAAFERFRKALYPIKNALIPLIEARNSDKLICWYSQSIDMDMNHRIDIFGNLIELDEPVSYKNMGTVLIEDSFSKTIDDGPFDISFGSVKMNISDSKAGFILKEGNDELIIGTPGAVIRFDDKPSSTVESGHFDKRRWITEKNISIQNNTLSLSPGLVKVKL